MPTLDGNKRFSFILAELFGRLHKQQCGKLHRFDVHTTARFDTFGDRFQTFAWYFEDLGRIYCQNWSRAEDIVEVDS